MKKLLSIIVALIFMFTLAACSDHLDAPESSNDSDNTTLPEHITMTQDGVWPENDYTEGLPVPLGTIEWVMLDSEQNICSISITDLNEGSYQEYMQDLSELGFSEVESVSEEIKAEGYVSVGTILSNGTKSLSIAYADEKMSIYIPKDSN